MTQLHINLPDDLGVRFQARAAEAGFDTVEQYAAELLRSDAGGEDYGAPEHLCFGTDEELQAKLAERLDDAAGSFEVKPQL